MYSAIRATDSDVSVAYSKLLPRSVAAWGPQWAALGQTICTDNTLIRTVNSVSLVRTIALGTFSQTPWRENMSVIENMLLFVFVSR